MRHSKIILVACISAIVAITTALLGVTGTVIGSVLSSVLYNVLSEFLEGPVKESSFHKKFEWEIAYLFPLIVIALIQFILIFAFLSEWGLLPETFLDVYQLLQHVANNSLYRIMGVSLLVMSIYPFVLKSKNINKAHGALIAFVGIIFLLRGFADAGNIISLTYGVLFHYFDFPIAIITLIILIFVIYRIAMYAFSSRFNPRNSMDLADLYDLKLKTISSEEVKNHRHHSDNFSYERKTPKNKNYNSKKIIPKSKAPRKHLEKTKMNNHSNSKINTSADDIEFVSNDLLKDIKKK